MPRSKPRNGVNERVEGDRGDGSVDLGDAEYVSPDIAAAMEGQAVVFDRTLVDSPQPELVLDPLEQVDGDDTGA